MKGSSCSLPYACAPSPQSLAALPQHPQAWHRQMGWTAQSKQLTSFIWLERAPIWQPMHGLTMLHIFERVPDLTVTRKLGCIRATMGMQLQEQQNLWQAVSG